MHRQDLVDASSMLRSELATAEGTRSSTLKDDGKMSSNMETNDKSDDFNERLKAFWFGIGPVSTQLREAIRRIVVSQDQRSVSEQLPDLIVQADALSKSSSLTLPEIELSRWLIKARHSVDALDRGGKFAIRWRDGEVHCPTACDTLTAFAVKLLVEAQPMRDMPPEELTTGMVRSWLSRINLDDHERCSQQAEQELWKLLGILDEELNVVPRRQNAEVAAARAEVMQMRVRNSLSQNEKTGSLDADFKDHTGQWITAEYCQNRYEMNPKTLSRWASEDTGCPHLEKRRPLRRMKFAVDAQRPRQKVWCFHRVDIETISNALDSPESA